MSSAAGIILDIAIKIYSSIAIYQPVVNGVGGNLVAIFASRIGTALYSTEIPGKWATWAPRRWYNFPLDVFFCEKSKQQNKLNLAYDFLFELYAITHS
jgi:hypothetical protein